MIKWQGQPLIRHIACNALEACLSPIIVVLGAFVDPIKEALNGLPVTFVINNDYEKGMATSLRLGFKSLPKTIKGTFLFLGDQPYVDQLLITSMIQNYNKADVIIPCYQNQPGHPVLWNHTTFTRVQHMTEQETGRGIQKEFTCSFLDWPDSMILRDIDTKEDYQNLLNDHLSG